MSTGPALEPLTIGNRGDLPNERVQLVVTRDVNTTFYILIATHELSPGRINSGFRTSYWFEPTDVKAGDHVIIYTKAGTYKRAPRPDGHFNHFFYWGCSVALFGAPTARIVVAEINTWVTGA